MTKHPPLVEGGGGGGGVPILLPSWVEECTVEANRNPYFYATSIIQHHLQPIFYGLTYSLSLSVGAEFSPFVRNAFNSNGKHWWEI